MKTSEFEQIVESLGYEFNGYRVTHPKYGCIVDISREETYRIDSDWRGTGELSDKEKKELFCHVYEYTATPIEERTEEILYYVQFVDDSTGFLNISSQSGRKTVDNKTENNGWLTQFTEDEINKINPKYMEFAIPVDDYNPLDDI